MLDVFEKFPPHRRPDAPAVQRQPLAMMLLQLFHLARQGAALETADGTVLAIHPVHALMPGCALEFIERHRGMAQRVAERFRQVGQIAQHRQQFGKHAGLLAQLTEHCRPVPED